MNLQSSICFRFSNVGDPQDHNIETRLASSDPPARSYPTPKVVQGGYGFLVVDKPIGWSAQCDRKYSDLSRQQFINYVTGKTDAPHGGIDLQHWIIHELAEELPFLKEMRLMPPVAKKSTGWLSHFGQLYPLDAETSGLVLLGTRPSSLPLLHAGLLDTCIHNF